MHVFVNVKRIGVAHPIQKGSAYRAAAVFSKHGTAAGVENSGLDLPDVGVNRATQNDHLQYRHEQSKQHRHAVTAHVPRFLVENGGKTAKRTGHDANSISACRRWLSSTNASSSVGSNGRISSTSMPWPRSSCSSSSPCTVSSTRAWIDRPKIVALLNSDISRALRRAVVMAGAKISKRCVPAGVTSGSARSESGVP